MKKIFTGFLLLLAQISFGQDCNTQAANKPSVYVRGQDFSDDMGSDKTQKPTSQEIAKMKLNLGNAEGWLKNRLTGFTGAKLLYYNNFYFNTLDFVENKDPNNLSGYEENYYQATGIKGYYYSNMMFFAYYCYDNTLPLHTEDESGSSVKVIFNNVLASDLCTDVGVFTINGKFAFKKFEKIRSEGRIDFYERRAKSDESDEYPSKLDFIIIRNSDKPVFIPITRKEYLEQMQKDIQVYKTKRKEFLNSFYETRIKDFEKEMSTYKSDRLYTPEKEAKRRLWFKEDVNPEKLAKDLKKVDDEVNGSSQIITEYLGKPTEWLSRGFSTFYPWSFESYHPAGVRDYFEKLDVFTESREDLSRTEIVSINPEYFNKAMGRDVPQLILVTAAKGTYPHMRKVSTLIKQTGTLAPLEAIINSDQ